LSRQISVKLGVEFIKRMGCAQATSNQHRSSLLRPS
jgi:hypothetical protein